VAVRGGGIPELVVHGLTGFLVDSATPEALAPALLDSIRRGPDEMETLARNARATWCDRYTLTRYQQEMLSFIERFVRQTDSAAA
jgi:glycosyltransferase involved in cell wall biosynthesis